MVVPTDPPEASGGQDEALTGSYYEGFVFLFLAISTSLVQVPQATLHFSFPVFFRGLFGVDEEIQF